MGEYRDEPFRVDSLTRRPGEPDRVVDVEPRARELDQDGGRPIQPKPVESPAQRLGRVHLAPPAEIEPHPLGSWLHRRECFLVAPLALRRPGKRVQRLVHVRRREQHTRVPALAAARQSSSPSSTDTAPSSPDGTTWECTSTKRGAITSQTLPERPPRRRR
jgi:hypothetical protein